MNPVQAVRSCFRQYAGFSGRASRSEFWWWYLFIGVGYWITAGLGGSFEGAPNILFVLFQCAIFIPTLAVGVRRLHDRGWRGWWMFPYVYCFAIELYSFWVGQTSAFMHGYLIGIFPPLSGVLLVLLIVMVRMFLRGTEGDNRFGSDPLQTPE